MAYRSHYGAGYGQARRMFASRPASSMPPTTNAQLRRDYIKYLGWSRDPELENKVCHVCGKPAKWWQEVTGRPECAEHNEILKAEKNK